MAERTRLYSGESAEPPEVVAGQPGEPTVVPEQGAGETEDDGEE